MEEVNFFDLAWWCFNTCKGLFMVSFDCLLSMVSSSTYLTSADFLVRWKFKLGLMGKRMQNLLVLVLDLALLLCQRRKMHNKLRLLFLTLGIVASLQGKRLVSPHKCLPDVYLKGICFMLLIMAFVFQSILVAFWRSRHGRSRPLQIHNEG